MSRMEEVYTLKNADVKYEGDKAILVNYDGLDIWIPLSQVSSIDRYPHGQIDITMSAWIAKTKGFI